MFHRWSGCRPSHPYLCKCTTKYFIIKSIGTKLSKCQSNEPETKIILWKSIASIISSAKFTFISFKYCAISNLIHIPFFLSLHHVSFLMHQPAKQQHPFSSFKLSTCFHLFGGSSSLSIFYEERACFAQWLCGGGSWYRAWGRLRKSPQQFRPTFSFLYSTLSSFLFYISYFSLSLSERGTEARSNLFCSFW